MNIKRVCVVTGTRAEYGILQILIKKIDQSNKLELCLMVTGIHLLKKYGNTVDQIIKDGFKIDKIIPMYEETEQGSDQLGISVGKGVINFTKAFDELKPDILIVLGDRYEPLAAVIAASTLSIPIAHIHGGDVTRLIDEHIRHAITKFAHIHFPGSAKSAKRIELMGEEPWRIKLFGSLSIDAIYQEKEKLLNKNNICIKLGLDDKKELTICIQHPDTFKSKEAGNQMKLTLDILNELKLQTVIIYPNNDPGSELIIDEIEANRHIPYFKIFKNLPRHDYLSLLKNADLLIGNSSSGSIETSIFKLPVVNIGPRELPRERAGNVIDVPHKYSEILGAVKRALSKEFKEKCQIVVNPYGLGTTSEKIVEYLEKLEITHELLEKKLTYAL